MYQLTTAIEHIVGIRPTYVPTDVPHMCKMMRVQVVIVASFVISKEWKQHKYPSTDHWFCKLWNVQTVEQCALVKKSESALYVRPSRTVFKERKAKSRTGHTLCHHTVKTKGKKW